MANGYVDQIYWNFQGALVCSIISVVLYQRFLRSGRIAYHLYALSLVVWLLAIGTYTFSAVGLAVAYLAMTFGDLYWRLAVMESGSNWH